MSHVTSKNVSISNWSDREIYHFESGYFENGSLRHWSLGKEVTSKVIGSKMSHFEKDHFWKGSFQNRLLPKWITWKKARSKWVTSKWIASEMCHFEIDCTQNRSLRKWSLRGFRGYPVLTDKFIEVTSFSKRPFSLGIDF